MVIEIRDGSEVPIYLQLRNQIVSGISAGALEPGEQLPTVRALAAELGVNAMTVSKAYQMLNRRASSSPTGAAAPGCGSGGRRTEP